MSSQVTKYQLWAQNCVELLAEAQKGRKKSPCHWGQHTLNRESSMFTGSDFYRAIQGSQLLDHAGQTWVQWEEWGSKCAWKWSLGDFRGDRLGLEGTVPIPTYFVLCSSLLSAIFQNPFPHLLEHGQPDFLSLPAFSSLPFLIIIFLLTSSSHKHAKHHCCFWFLPPFLSSSQMFSCYSFCRELSHLHSCLAQA